MRLEAALRMLKKREYRQSIQLYREIVEQEPENNQAHAGLALSLAAVGEYEAAERAANHALAMDKKSEYAHLALAILCHSRQQVEKFVDEVERAFYSKPFVFDVASKYAELLTAEKDITRALPLFLKMFEEDDDKDCRHYYLALVHFQLRNPKLAIEQSLVALKRHPSIKSLSLVVKLTFGMLPILSSFLLLFFLSSIGGLFRLKSALPWYLFVLLILTYVLAWGLTCVLFFSYSGLSARRHRKRAPALLVLTLIDAGIFLGILVSLIF